MRWADFLDTADRLSQGSTEGDWRSAVSRGYYAVFHCLREFFLANGLDVGQGGQAHFNLYSELLNCGFPAVARIASRVDRLREWRGWADYDLGRAVAQRQATRGFQESKVVIADFQALLVTLPASQIADGARRHLQAIGRHGRTP